MRARPTLTLILVTLAAPLTAQPVSTGAPPPLLATPTPQATTTGPAITGPAAPTTSGVDSPAAPAESAVDRSQRRVRQVIVFGNDPCPKSTDPDEIVVCARRPAEEQYRLPPVVREQATQSRRGDSWAARARGLENLGRTDKCSAVGNADLNACQLQEGLERVREERRQREAAEQVPEQ
jgi:hypothetical protein